MQTPENRTQINTDDTDFIILLMVSRVFAGSQDADNKEENLC
jgi:hypothetical protein